MKARTGAGIGFEFDPASVGVHDLGDDRKAQAYTVLFRRAKRVKYLLAQFRRHSGTGVPDRDSYSSPAAGSFPDDRDAQDALTNVVRRAHRLKRVLNQICEDALAELFIRRDIRRV